MSRTPWNALIDACKEGAEGKCERDVQVFFEVVEEMIFGLAASAHGLLHFWCSKLAILLSDSVEASR